MKNLSNFENTKIESPSLLSENCAKFSEENPIMTKFDRKRLLIESKFVEALFGSFEFKFYSFGVLSWNISKC